MSDVIQLQVFDCGKLLDQCIWNVLRIRLNLPFIETLINRTVCEVPQLRHKQIMYLQSLDDGDIVLVDHMQHVCRCRPARYAIKMIEPIRFMHPSVKGIYNGTFTLCARRIPRISLNEIEVTSEHIRSWLIRGILQEHEKLQAYEKVLNKLSFDMQQLLGTIENSMEKEILNLEQDRIHQLFEKTKEDRDKFVVEFISQSNLIVELETECKEFHTYSIKFSGSQQDWFNSLVMQKDWTASTLLAFTFDENEIDDFIRPGVKFRKYMVDLSGVILETVENGWGTLHYREINEDLMFHGSYKNGKIEGSGIHISSSAIHVGPFSGNLCGEGTKVTKYGDILTGKFSGCETILHPSLLSENPYTRTEANGYMKVIFADGSRFQGSMVNGAFSGAGIYSSSSKYIEGRFHRGVLECGKVQWANSQVQASFKGGLIHGRSLITIPGRYLQGFATYGEICNRASEDYICRRNTNMRFIGNFVNGSKAGHGSMNDRVSNTNITDSMWIGHHPRHGRYSMTDPIFIPKSISQDKYTKLDLLSTDAFPSFTKKTLCFRTLVQELIDEYAVSSPECNYDDKYVVSFDVDVIIDRDLTNKRKLSELAVRHKKGFDRVIQLKLHELFT